MRLLPLLLAATLFSDESLVERREARRRLREVLGRNEVVFTFDDGPHPDVTPRILEALEERGVRAAFFACGIQIEKGARGRTGRRILRQEIDGGHLVGTHTVHHPRLSALEEKAVEEEIGGGIDLVERAIGRRPSLFRPPFGDLPAAAADVVRKRDLDLVLWTTNVRDYRIADPATIAAGILGELERRGGGVVLLHDTHPPSADALPLILDGIEPINERREEGGLPALTIARPETLLGLSREGD